LSIVRLVGSSSLVISSDIHGVGLVCPSSSINITTTEPIGVIENQSQLRNHIYIQSLKFGDEAILTNLSTSKSKLESTSHLRVRTGGYYAYLGINNQIKPHFKDSANLQVEGLFTTKPNPTSSIISSRLPTSDFDSLNYSRQTRINVYNCCYLSGESSIQIRIKQKPNELKKNAILIIHNYAPDYLQTLGDCIEYSTSEIDEIGIPVKVGELINIVELDDEIEKIQNKPFSIAYSGNSIYGRIIIEKEIVMTVYLKSGKVIKVRLIPYRSEFLKQALNQ